MMKRVPVFMLLCPSVILSPSCLIAHTSPLKRGLTPLTGSYWETCWIPVERDSAHLLLKSPMCTHPVCNDINKTGL